MPARDGTGPQGQGTRTGRGLGNCSQNSKDNFDTAFNFNRPRGFGRRDFGRDFGRGRGFGRGRVDFSR